MKISCRVCRSMYPGQLQNPALVGMCAPTETRLRRDNAACEVKNLTSPSLEFVPSVLRRWLMHDSNSVRPVQPYSIDGTGGTRDFGHHSITMSLCHTIFYNKFSERSSCSRPARLRTRTTTSCPPRQPTRLPS